MLISVIIPTYNEENAIAQCLTSLKLQSEKDFEIIVVDDGSNDNTLSIVEKLKTAKTPKLKILTQAHLGPATARNFGASKSKGKILVFVDADMTFDSKFLANLIKPITTTPRVSGAGGQAKGTFSKEEYVSNWKNVWARCWNINANLPEKRRLPLNYPDHQKVFRAILKSEFDRVDGFSKGGYTDDYTLSKKLGYEASVAPEAIFYHKNPDTLREVYLQAKWVGKREYKLGVVGILVALIRTSFPVSIISALWKSRLKYPFWGQGYMRFKFQVFKLVYDFGIFIGILEMIFIRKTAK